MRQARDTASQVAIRHGQELDGTALGAGRSAGALGAGPERAAGLWAMHLAHSACF